MRNLLAAMDRPSPLVVVFLLALCFPACVSTPETGVDMPAPDPHQLLSSLKEQQVSVTTFRGIGKLHYTIDGQRHATRVAWIGSLPANLRIETLGLFGQPNLTLLVKGSALYLHAPGEDRCWQAKATARNVSRLVSVPLPVKDLFVILSGQIPIRPFGRVKMQYLEPEAQWCLSLYKKWGRLVERMWTNGMRRAVNRIEVFDGGGDLLYTAIFSRFEPLEDFLIPKKVVVSSEQGASFSLDVERLSTNVEVPAAAYTVHVVCGARSGP